MDDRLGREVITLKRIKVDVEMDSSQNDLEDLHLIVLPVPIENDDVNGRGILVEISPELRKEILNEATRLKSMGVTNVMVVINEKGLVPHFAPGNEYTDFHRAMEYCNHRLIATVFGCKVYLYLGAPRTFGIGE